MMEGAQGNNKDFGQVLVSMCRDNMKMTKKLAKIFVKELNS